MANGKDQEGFDTLQSYPFMTTGLQGWLAQTGEIGGVRSSPGRQIVAGALRDLLGVSASVRDPQGFTNALRQAVTFEHFEGRRIARWARPGYSVKINQQGATGAQASLLAHTYTALEKASPLLGALKPLSCCPANQEVGEIRELVNEKLQMLGDDLGSLGGPHSRWVDTIFDQLLGENFDPEADPEEVGGLLGEMRSRLGMARANVNTFEDEQRLTDFIIAHSQLSGMWQSWQAQRDYFDPSSGKEYLGTQLVTLGRHLADLGDLVQRSYLVMDSVFIGPAVRENAIFELNGDRFTLAELFAWAERLSRVKIRSKDAAATVKVELETLHDLMDEVATTCSQGGGSFVIDALCTPRVQRVLDEMVAWLDFAVQAAGRIKLLPPPLASALMPDEGELGEVLTVFVFGEQFAEGVCLEMGEGIGVQSCQRLSANLLKALLLIDENADTGLRDVIVRNTDGQAFVLEDGFDVLEGENGGEPVPEPGAGPQPEIDGVDPSSGDPGQGLNITVHGRNFSDQAALSMGPGIQIFSQKNTPQTIFAAIRIAVDADSGPRDVQVMNPENNLNSWRMAAFHVNDVIESEFGIDEIVVEDSGPPITLQVTGQGFDRLERVAVKERSFARVDQAEHVDNHTLRVLVELAENVDRDMQLTLVVVSTAREKDEETFLATHVGDEDASPPPVGLVVVDHLDPSHGPPNRTMWVDVYGAGFRDDSSISFGPSIRIRKLEVIDANHMRARITIRELPAGHVEEMPRDVTISVPGEQDFVFKGGFAIRPMPSDLDK